jgi:hypothetical protein
MGLSECSLEIDDSKADELIEKAPDIDGNAEKLRSLIRQRAEQYREALDEGYEYISVRDMQRNA